MSREVEILGADRAHVWHPYTAVDDPRPPLHIVRDEGARLFDASGRSFLDGNSSWWVATLGHRHPRLVAALKRQVDELAHTALAGITHEPAALLAREIVEAAPAGLSRVLFSDDGSTAVEAALKIAVQYFAQNGQPQRNRFVALAGAFHGDTAGATSLGGVELFRRQFAPLLFDVVHVAPPLVDEADDAPFARAFAAIETLLGRDGKTIAAVVVEPIVQGAAGMRIYGADYLAKLRALTREAGALLIADEVFTGYGRTGTMWACAHAGVAPDLLCTAKGFSGGLLPMAATLATDEIYAGFGGGRARALLHGHSFTGNPLGAAVAREVLATYREERVIENAVRKAQRLRKMIDELAEREDVLRVRQVGMIAAVDLREAGRGGSGSGYLGEVGWRVYDEGLKRGAYLRPLGDTVYLAPPLNISDEELDELCEIFVASIDAACGATACSPA